MKNLTLLLTCVIVLAVGAGQSAGQYKWTKDAGNPVFSGVRGTWSTHVFCPSVLFNPDSARFEMWFNSCPGPNSDPAWRPYSVGRAVSKDGVHWAIDPFPVLSPDAGKWDNSTIDVPEVIREKTQSAVLYKMWYTSWANSTSPDYLGYATSPDGIRWTKYSGNPIFGPGSAAWEAGGPWGVSIVPFQGGYRMWYSAYIAGFGVTSIGYATSADGLSWQRDTVHNPVLVGGATGQWDDAGLWMPDVVAIGDSLYLFYVGDHSGGNGRTGVAASLDGVTWTKCGANPVLVPGGFDTWDNDRSCVGATLLVRDTLHMWYDGWIKPFTANQYSIGHAWSPIPPTGIDPSNGLPETYSLSQNYPNPFNPVTTIRYALPHRSDVTLAVYNPLGQLVTMLVREPQEAGYHELKFDGLNLASGVYFYRLKAESFVETKKLLLLR